MNLKKDRNKILVSIPKILQKIKNINEDKNNNQTNLFGNTDVQGTVEFQKASPWTQKSF